MKSRYFIAGFSIVIFELLAALIYLISQTDFSWFNPVWIIAAVGLIIFIALNIFAIICIIKSIGEEDEEIKGDYY